MAQLEMTIERPREPDRNHAKGGRSFYFFDFDDNVMHLPTELFLFHRATGAQKALTTGEFAQISHLIGKEDPWLNYEIRMDPQTGSFRRFRHKKIGFLGLLLRRQQPILEDIQKALRLPEKQWKGPSWDFFWHAVHNGRPLSIITARGHRPGDISDAIKSIKSKGHLTQLPNYLSIYPVSHGPTRQLLGDLSEVWSTAELKKAAIFRSVNEAFRVYGPNPAHRFGMSDDDPTNVKLVIEAMQELKVKFPQNSFFVIDTRGGQLFKNEVFADSVKPAEPLPNNQLSLF